MTARLPTTLPGFATGVAPDVAPGSTPDLTLPFLADERKLLFIHGEWCAPASNAWSPTMDPSNGRVIMHVARADAADVARGARAAHNALFGPWGMMRPAERARLLLDLALALEAHRDELARVETTDHGKPLAHALGEAEAAANALRFCAGAPQRMEGTMLASGVRQHAFVRRERIGVCGLLLSWRQPLLSAARELGAALAAGNTVLLRPASQAPLSTVRLIELAEQVGFPRGTINLLTGDGDADLAIVAHPLVAKVFFSGCAGTARAIAAQAAALMKPLALDIGGRSPHIVFADADLAAAAPAVMRAAFAQPWHPLAAGSRVLVDKAVHERFLQMLVASAERLVVGPGIEPGVEVGPLVSLAQRDRFATSLEAAQAERLGVAAGGRLIDGPGNFVQPTIVDGVRPDSAFARSDAVGPLLGVSSFETGQDTARLAAAVGDCAGSSVWTRDLARAQAMPGALRARTVWINASLHRGEDLRPTGTELHAYTDLKTVIMNTETASR